MPTTSSFTSSGALKYTTKRAFVATTGIVDNGNPFQNLLACFIVTDVQNLSFKVVANGVTIGHFVNEQIVSWEVNDNIINIQTKDEVTYTLLFAAVRECLLADQRIDDNINGLITTGC